MTTTPRPHPRPSRARWLKLAAASLIMLAAPSALPSCAESLVRVSPGEPEPANDLAHDLAHDLGGPGPTDQPDDLLASDLASSDLRPSDMAQPDLDALDLDALDLDPPDMGPSDMGASDMAASDMTPPVAPSDPVSAKVTSSCTTESVKGLSQQLIDEMNCLQPGLMTSFAGLSNVRTYSAVFPYLQAPATRGLEQVVAGQGALTISSALRTLPQQYLLYRWYQLRRCGISLAARPGQSNHNGGLAVDTPDYSPWRSRFEARSWSWLGSSDPVHFDFRGGQDIRAVSVRAFQRLWNRNNPQDPIAEDGAYGPQTEARLARSPSGGFRQGARCASRALLAPEQVGVSLHWSPEDGDATPSSAWIVAPAAVWRVEVWRQDQLVYEASREDAWAIGPHFDALRPTWLRGHLRLLALDAEGRLLDEQEALIDPARGLYVRPLGFGRFALRLTDAWTFGSTPDQVKLQPWPSAHALGSTQDPTLKPALELEPELAPELGLWLPPSTALRQVWLRAGDDPPWPLLEPAQREPRQAQDHPGAHHVR